MSIGIIGTSEQLDRAGARELETARAILAQAAQSAVETWPSIFRPALQPVSMAAAEISGPQSQPAPDLPSPPSSCDAFVVLTEPGSHADAFAREVQAAAIRGAPLLRIGAGDPPAIVFVTGASDELGPSAPPQASQTEPSASAIARAILAPPPIAQERAKLKAYLQEGIPRSTRRFEYDLILRLIGSPAAQAKKPERDEWLAAENLARSLGREWERRIAAIRDAFEYADRHALYYGEKWRSAVVARSLLLLLPLIISGAVGIAAPDATVVTIPVQIASMLGIMWDSRQAARGRWRQKWIEYRNLAERLRCLRFLQIAGIAAPADPAQPTSWVEWYATRLERALGAVPKPAAEAAASILDHIVDVEIKGQMGYHREALRRFWAIDVRIRCITRATLRAAIVLGTVLFGVGLLRRGVAGIPWRVLTSLGLTIAPMAVSQLNDLRNAFDLVRLSERSARTVSGLARLVRAVRRRKASLDLAKAAACRAAEIMSEEVSSWRATLEVRSARLRRH